MGYKDHSYRIFLKNVHTDNLLDPAKIYVDSTHFINKDHYEVNADGFFHVSAVDAALQGNCLHELLQCLRDTRDPDGLEGFRKEAAGCSG
jgi:hypothetical protein